jgi:hypothetical protein
VLWEPGLFAHGTVRPLERDGRPRPPQVLAQGYRQHIVHTLRDLGYWSALIGEQHISKKPDIIGYDEVVKISTSHTDDVVPVTLDLLERASFSTPSTPKGWPRTR